MPDLDKALAKSIQKAKQKPRNFVIVGKGSNVLKLLVDRKRIPPSDVTAAKKESGGNSTIQGVLTGGAGPELIFQVLELPSITAVKLRNFILETTGLTLKPQFEVLPSLTEVDEAGDEESEEAEASEGPGPRAKSSAPPPTPPVPPPSSSPPPTSSSSSTSPSSPPPSSSPPPISPPPSPEAVNFNARLKRFLPAIMRANSAKLPIGPKLVSLANEAGDFAKARDLAAGNARLDEIEELLKGPIKPTDASKPPVAEKRQPTQEQIAEPKPFKRPKVDNAATKAAVAFEAAHKTAVAQIAKVTELLDGVAKVAMDKADERIAQSRRHVNNEAITAATAFEAQRRSAVDRIGKVASILEQVEMLAERFGIGSLVD